MTNKEAHVSRTALTATVVFTLLTFSTTADAAQSPRCTAENGQSLIEKGRYEAAIREFSCVIGAAPTEVEGYRGRIEARLLLGQYSEAVRDYTKVTAFVLPVHPDAATTIYGGYAARLSIDPDNVTALMAGSFARWYFFDYNGAIHMINDLLDVQPGSVYGNLFRGSSRILQGATAAKGVVDLEVALALEPDSPDVRFIVADAYTYGISDPARAFFEASLAFAGGLDTPRVNAMLAAAYNAFGDELAAAAHIERHFELVTTELLPTAPLTAGGSMNLGVVPGRVYEIPITVSAGEKISIATSSHDYWDTILLLYAPDGTAILGRDDDKAYFAAFERVAGVSGTYRIQVTFFEGVITGSLLVQRGK
ncbi:MAG TPA: hypothetical protein VFR18_17660 [Terriglobia bacterium]|nr:hypothetical protein [Terriglobia bacterium]